MITQHHIIQFLLIVFALILAAYLTATMPKKTEHKAVKEAVTKAVVAAEKKLHAPRQARRAESRRAAKPKAKPRTERSAMLGFAKLWEVQSKQPRVLSRMKFEVGNLIVPAITTGIQNQARVLGSVMLNPLTMGVTGRLANIAKLFEKFRFNYITVHYKPMVAVTTPGLMFMAFDNDPQDSLSTLAGETLISALQGMGRRALIFEVFSEASLTVRGKDFFSQLLYVDPTAQADRWAQAGKLVWGCISPYPASINAGLISAVSEITLEVPTVSEVSGQGAGWAHWMITGPSGNVPWGNSSPRSPYSNIDVTLLQTDPVTGGSKSGLRFGSPGIYFITWYQTITSPTTGTMTLTNCSYFNSVDGFPSAFNPKIFHPAGEGIGWAIILAPVGGAYLTYTSGGTHTTPTPNYNTLDVFLLPLSLSQAGALASTLEQQVEELVNKRLEALTERLSLSEKPKPQVQVLTGTSSEVIHNYNGFDQVVDGSTSTNQELPLETISLDPARQVCRKTARACVTRQLEEALRLPPSAQAERALDRVQRRLSWIDRQTSEFVDLRAMDGVPEDVDTDPSQLRGGAPRPAAGLQQKL